ncbi:MAG TPA: ABC transporter substrate-binding protein, partial [Dehalococcoidia bacterium]|nr:ABC transporter substrate-binding protein [Dehalococcoidia bacterium]
GWIVPAQYYQQVGPDGFKQKPIGAGPYKFVSFNGNDLELEAFTDYWRKTPSVKTLIMRGLPEGTTRVAAFQAGEADFIQSIPGELVETIRADPRLTIAPVQSSPWWLEMIGLEKPESPFNKKQVREAVSLALDRRALSDAETAGLSKPFGNWILPEWPGAIEWPVFPHDPARARQLLAEAGYPDGFDVEALTPLPPFFSLGERVITQLREVGIRTRLNQMERAAFQTKTGEGPNAFSGFLLMNSAAPGDAASWVRSYATCQGTSSRTCLPEIEEPFARFEQSVDPQERERILNDIQRYMLENYIFVPVYRLGSPKGVGPRIANPWQEVFASIPQYFFVGPYEDIRLKE